MKPKSHAAVIRSMKTYKKKKAAGQTPANAIIKKLSEIKNSSNEAAGREVKIALFRHLGAIL